MAHPLNDERSSEVLASSHTKSPRCSKIRAVHLCAQSHRRHDDSSQRFATKDVNKLYPISHTS